MPVGSWVYGPGSGWSPPYGVMLQRAWQFRQRRRSPVFACTGVLPHHGQRFSWIAMFTFSRSGIL